MTAKAPTPMSEGMNRDNRPKAPAAPPKPPLMRVGANGYPCPLCGSGMFDDLSEVGTLFDQYLCHSSDKA